MDASKQPTRTGKSNAIRIGWAQADITPDRPVMVSGQFHARVSESVGDPVTATTLALDSGDAGRVVLISCDLVSIPDGLRDAIRKRLCADVPDLTPTDIVLNATHTHTGPEVRVENPEVRLEQAAAQTGGDMPTRFGLPVGHLDVMDPADYVTFAVERIASAAARAWRERAPGGIGFGLSQAVVGRNRRIS